MKHYHLMGIGGIGVSGLARVLKSKGYTVSGCDTSASPTTQALEAAGIEVLTGHSADHLQGVDVLVASTAIPESNPEIVGAKAKGIEVWRRIQVVGELVKQGKSVCVTGSHGKTSVSAMLSCIHMQAHTDPTIFLGAELAAIGGNMRVGKSDTYIAEVDESDPLFQHVQSTYAIINNLEDDHVAKDGIAKPNYYATYDELQQAIRTFAQNSQTVIYNGDAKWAILDQLTAGCKRVSFGMADTLEVQAANMSLSGFNSSFDLIYFGQNLGRIVLQVPGEHNICNALAALTAALLDGISFEVAQQALANFNGAARRFERLGDLNGAIVVSDYAHNATKVDSVLKAAHSTGMRVRVVFQPHRYGRAEQEFPSYAVSLERADEILMLDVYAASETPINMTSQQIVGSIVAHLRSKQKPVQHQDWLSHKAHLLSTAQAGDLIMFVGAGSVDAMARTMLQEVQA